MKSLSEYVKTAEAARILGTKRRESPRAFTTAWLPFSRWREQGPGGMRVEEHWFARGLSPSFHSAD